MANYGQMLEAYLTDCQPDLKAELVQRGELQNWLVEQANAMQEVRAQLLVQLNERMPQLSPLQRDMEADRTVIEMFLTPV